jgi:hypothetical protein
MASGVICNPSAASAPGEVCESLPALTLHSGTSVYEIYPDEIPA